MASLGNNGQAANGLATLAARKPSTRAPVVPVIPLPYTQQRRPKPQLARQPTSAAPPSPPSAATTHSTSTTSSPATPSGTDSEAGNNSNIKESTPSSPKPDLPEAESPKAESPKTDANSNGLSVTDGIPVAVGVGDTAVPAPKETAADAADAADAAIHKTQEPAGRRESIHSTAPISAIPHRIAPRPLFASTIPAGLPPAPHSANPYTAQYPSFAVPRIHPESIRQALRPPPLRQPLDQGHPVFHRGHPNHPSDGSIVFGAFQGSNNTSPAPLSGGLFPPPSFIPPYMAYPGPPMGEWGPPPHLFADAANGHRATGAAANFGPSSPQSFHGSHGSIHMDEMGYARPTSALDGNQNGYGAPNNDMPPPASTSTPPVYLPQAFPIPPPPGIGLNFAGPRAVDPRMLQSIHQHLQRSYGETESADCLIRVRISDESTGPDPQQPFSFLGHRIILGQSETVRHIFRSQHPVPQPGPFGPVLVYNLHFTDRNITYHATKLALRSMYGLPLDEVTDADDTARSAMHKALAYVAAGSVLMLPYVEGAGLEYAAQFIKWDTIEKALGFCLVGASSLDLTSDNESIGMVAPMAVLKYENGYGQAVRDFLHQIMAFIVANFPPNFVLDTAVPALGPGATYVRIPPTSGGSAVVQDVTNISPPRVEGIPHRPNQTRLSQDPRLAQIRFGDVSPPKPNGYVPTGDIESPGAERPPMAPAAPAGEDHSVDDNIQATLSRILINLPFGYLKRVLEDGELGRASGWIQNEDRIQIMRDVVAEREARRHHALEEVRSQRVPQWGSITARIHNPQPFRGGPHDEWDVLGWEEKIVSGIGNVPTMVRIWEAAPSNNNGRF